jgi:alkylhydroperoxidase family enzyme
MTWLPINGGLSSERDAVLGLHPEVYARYQELLDATSDATDTDLLELCKLRMAQHFGCREELARHSADEQATVESWERSTSLTTRERAALQFVEQFVLDPGLISAELVAELEAELGTRGVIDFTMAIAAHDTSLRFSTLLDFAPAD